MQKLYVFEADRITGLCEGEHGAPILTPAALSPVSLPSQFQTVVYFYRGAEGQVAGPGLFMKLPQSFWPNHETPVFALLDPDIDY